MLSEATIPYSSGFDKVNSCNMFILSELEINRRAVERLAFEAVDIGRQACLSFLRGVNKRNP